MSGSVELGPDGTHLRIRFAYRDDLVAMVKELPDRRWDAQGKFWRVPATHVGVVLAACSRHLFDIAPELAGMLARAANGRDAAGVPAAPSTPTLPFAAATTAAPEPPAAAPIEPTTVPTLSVSALNATVRDGLRRRFPDAMWVVGEIVDFDKNAHRQHRFFTLVEKARGESRPVATLEVALFSAAAERLLPALAATCPPLALRDGLEVRLRVRLDLYVAGGRFQAIVEDVDPTFTLGKLALTKAQLLRELRETGLADRNRTLGFPVPALRIGVLTSPDADGWNDFLQHVGEAGVGLQLTLFPTRVQGVDQKATLLAGLRWFAARADCFDVVCIVRGGGSRTDLAGYDDRDVAFAVARHPLKVVVGVGHQRDQSVLDAIAHSEKTPTAVAELLVRAVRQARADVADRTARLLACAHATIDRHTSTLQRRARDLQRTTEIRVLRADARLVTAARALGDAAERRVRRERARLTRAAVQLVHGAQRRCDAAAATLDHHATQLRLLDPRAVLARGFTLVVGADGRIAPSLAAITAGQHVVVRFRDGHARTLVEHVHHDP